MDRLTHPLGVLLLTAGLHAQSLWQPSPGHTQVPIWPGAIPDARPDSSPEVATSRDESPVAGRPWVYIEHVTRPTLTVYAPVEHNSGAAVVVFPGGGYQILAIDLEGSEVCDWLVTNGITCVLLKYRVPGNGRRPHSGPYPSSPQALEDAQRTLGLVRFHASEWHIDPHRIGVLGFSAGGHLVAAMSTHFQRVYRAVDAADSVSCRPDFGVALYPGHLSLPPRPHVLNPNVPVTGETPPQFLVQAEDDPVDPVENSLVYFAALERAGVPVEMHIFAHGGHAFGLRRTEQPITQWPALVEKWLRTIGIVKDE